MSEITYDKIQKLFAEAKKENQVEEVGFTFHPKDNSFSISTKSNIVIMFVVPTMTNLLVNDDAYVDRQTLIKEFTELKETTERENLLIQLRETYDNPSRPNVYWVFNLNPEERKKEIYSIDKLRKDVIGTITSEEFMGVACERD